MFDLVLVVLIVLMFIRIRNLEEDRDHNVIAIRKHIDRLDARIDAINDKG